MKCVQFLGTQPKKKKKKKKKKKAHTQRPFLAPSSCLVVFVVIAKPFRLFPFIIGAVMALLAKNALPHKQSQKLRGGKSVFCATAAYSLCVVSFVCLSNH
jgi:hypothetical protein